MSYGGISAVCEIRESTIHMLLKNLIKTLVKIIILRLFQKDTVDADVSIKLRLKVGNLIMN